MEHPIYIIVAADDENGIGKNGKLPWHLKNELKYFQDVTTKTNDPNKQNMVLMGRSTWESIPEEHRPLKDRVNVVLTRNEEYETPGAEKFSSLDDAINSARDNIETIFVIGGARVIEQVIADSRLTGVYLTRVAGNFNCDTAIPPIPESFGEPKVLGGGEEDGGSYEYLLYEKSGGPGRN